MDTHFMAQKCTDPGFVECDPVVDAVSQPMRDDSHILGKGLGCLATTPTADLVLQGLRQIPVIQGDERLNVCCQQSINQAVIKVESGRIDLSSASGQDTRPSNGEAIGLQVELTHELDVLLKAVIVIAGYQTTFIIEDITRRCTEAVPDRFAASLFVGRPFDLIGGCCSSPGEVVRKLDHSGSLP